MQTSRRSLVMGRPGTRAPSSFTGASLCLALTYLTLLAGRFTLNRIVPIEAPLDIRWMLFALLFTMCLVWASVSSLKVTGRTSRLALVLFLAWSGWMSLSLLWADQRVDPFDNLENFVLLAAGMIFCTFAAERLGPVSMDWLWWLILGSASVYLVGALVAGASFSGRFSAFGGGPNVFVRVMILGAIASLALVLDRKRSWPLLMTVPLCLGAILSGSRGGLLAGVAVAALAFVPIAMRLGASRLLILALLLTSGSWLAPKILGDSQVALMYDRFITKSLREGSMGSRDTLALDAWSLFLENPLVGSGAGSFAAAHGVGLHPHNLVLAVASEGGLIGLLLFAASCLLFARSILRIRPLGRDPVLLLVCALYVFFASLFSGDYYDSRFMWFFLVLGAVVVSGRETPRNRSPQRSLRGP